MSMNKRKRENIVFVFVIQVISQLMVFLISIISMVFCGHLGKTELAAVSLAAAVRKHTSIFQPLLAVIAFYKPALKCIYLAMH